MQAPSFSRLSSVRHHFQLSSPPKPLGRLESNFICNLNELNKLFVLSMVLDIMPMYAENKQTKKKLKKSSQNDTETDVLSRVFKCLSLVDRFLRKSSVYPFFHNLY